MTPAPAALSTRVLVVGAGLIGTSLGLALRRAGVGVALTDPDPDRLATAVARGAGREQPADDPDRPYDLAVLAVPPDVVARVLVDLQARGTARGYTDVASVKTAPVAQARALGADLGTFCGGHPVAGRERSGPESARADLFDGRPWVLTPTAETDEWVRAAAQALAVAAGAVPVVLDPAAHDHALALVSHAPQVVASALAARLAVAADDEVRLSGPGVRDTTRIAASDPQMWTQVALANAGPLGEVLDGVLADLTAVRAALRSGDGEPVRRLLQAGNTGRARLPGRHAAVARDPAFAVVPVVVEDAPGRLASIFADAGSAGVNIEDVRVEHSPGARAGVVELSVRVERAGDLAAALRQRGWSVPD